MRKKLAPFLLLVPQILLIIIFMMGLYTGITQSLGVIPAFGLTEPTLKYYKEVLTKPEMLTSVLYSLYIALASSAIAIVAGTVLCAILVMSEKTKGAVMRIVQLPLAVPHVVVGLFMIHILSQNGLLARIAFALGIIHTQTDFPLFIYDGKGIGIILAYLWKEIPFVIYFTIALMANINGNLGEAAVNLGAGRWTAFRRVTLPLCRNTILSSFLIIFVFSLGAYELPMILGVTVPKALPVLAYVQYIHPNLRNRPYAMALNGIVILISLVCALIYFHLIQKNVKGMIEKK